MSLNERDLLENKLRVRLIFLSVDASFAELACKQSQTLAEWSDANTNLKYLQQQIAEIKDKFNEFQVADAVAKRLTQNV
jgi:hypothetical protein